MTYIIVLNWNNYKDTIHCLGSLVNNLEGDNFKIIVCDNGSTDSSIDFIDNWYLNNKLNNDYLSTAEYKIFNYADIIHLKSNSEKGLYIINIGENLGYAKGNNVGIQFALNQDDMEYVWILNNDTEVECNSLNAMLKKFKNNDKLGICGSKLIYFNDRNRVQGVGGKVNSWLGSSYEIGCNEHKDKVFDEEKLSKNMDYVIGASMLICKRFLKDVGLLAEDYFLYFEEVDLCIRGKRKGYDFTVAQNSIVYHNQGSTAGSKQNLSLQGDYSSVRNRLFFTYKFYPYKLPIVYLTLFIVLFNRIKRRQYAKAKNVLKIMAFNFKKQKI